MRGTVDEGLTDDALWERAQEEQRLLITTDKGFIRHRHEPHYGLLVVRLARPNRREIHRRVLRALLDFGAEDWPGLVVVMRDTVRSIWRGPVPGPPPPP